MVLLDINMPELNGFEVAAKIRKQNHQVLIFFLSDRSDKADRLKGFDLQANDYLAKPFYPEELLARIRERFQCVDNRIETEIYTFGKSTFNYTTNEIRTGNNKVLITSRQAEILRILAKKPPCSRRSGNTVETCMGSFILCQFAGIECTNNLFTKSVAQ